MIELEDSTILYFQNRKWSNEELERLNQLKGMHQLMLMAVDHSVYDKWVEVFVDNPSLIDFEMATLDVNKFMECYNAFCRLVACKEYLNLKSK